MTLRKAVFLFFPLFVVLQLGCQKEPNRTPEVAPPTVQDLAKNPIFIAPTPLIKSTPNKLTPNIIHVDLSHIKTDVWILLPLYSNTEKYSKIEVLIPKLSLTGCEISDIFLYPFLGADRTHNPGRPEVFMGYNIEEDFNFDSDVTLTLSFKLKNRCQAADVSIIAIFRE